MVFLKTAYLSLFWKEALHVHIVLGMCVCMCHLHFIPLYNSAVKIKDVRKWLTYSTDCQS